MNQIYDILVGLAVACFLRPWELLRRFAGRTGPEVLQERLGNSPCPAACDRRVVIHAVSVGEMAAAEGIVARLAARVPDASILLTAGNRDGIAAGNRLRSRYPQIESVSRLPWDRIGALREWLGRLRPALFLVVETEIWPNLFRACAENEIALSIVNGRIPVRNFRSYRIARSFFRDVLGCARWIGAQSEEDRTRFVALGADPGRVQVYGNLKFDAPASNARELPGIESGAPGTLVVAGSTHPPEERLLLDCLATLRRNCAGVRLVLAPRRVARAPEIAKLAGRKGFRAALSSEIRESWEVLVLDEFGLLDPAFARADIAVIGGTFARHGGHNPLEAARHSKAIVAGPHRENFASIFAGLESAGALQSVAHWRELGAFLEKLLLDAGARQRLGERARAFADEGRGAADLYAVRIAAELA